MNILLKIWQNIIPSKLLIFLRFLIAPKDYKIRRKAVLKYYQNIDLKSEPIEVQEGVKFLRCHKFTPLPFKWILKYETLLPDIFRDETHQRFYVIFQGKKLYFPKHFTKMMVVWGTRSILKEQDPSSPHLYLTHNFQVEDNSIVVDAGVAEGNFALSIVEKAKKLYLIECDPNWVETLKITFAPWKEKVVFVEKYLSDINNESNINIDSLVQPDINEKYFIKMDIEGFEKKALAGMKTLINTCPNIKMNICTYHHPDDLIQIEKIISDYGFTWEVSNGYILFFHPNEEPKFRKALIRAEKTKK
jgi:hypothetical protein